MRCIVVADDLTGAMDAAGPLAARGLVTWMIASPEECDRAQIAGADVLSINTESRHLNADTARARISDSARRFAIASAEILFKKIDSTLRGNVVAETLALLTACGRSTAIVAPAFPALGRTTRGGVVYVGGVTLANTPFVRDALSPAPSAPLADLFAGDKRVVIANAVTDDDLRAIVRSYADNIGDVLFVGSGGLSAALAEAYFTTGAADAPKCNGPLLFVVGSRAAQSTAQIGALKSLGAGDALVVLQAPSGDGAAPEQVAASLAASVASALEERAYGAVIATGGDTASAILQRLKNPALRVLGEILPGIPYGRIGDTLFVTKAGGFGDPDAFVKISQKLAPTTR